MQFATELRVTAVPFEHPLVGIDPEREAGVGWVAERPFEIGILDNDRPADRHGLPHSSQHIDRPAEVLQQESAVRDVVRPGFGPFVDVRRPEFEVVQPLFDGRLRGQRELHLVHVDPHDRAVGSDLPKLEAHVAAPASQIQAARARCQPDAVEQGRGGGLPAPGQHLQPLIAPFTPPSSSREVSTTTPLVTVPMTVLKTALSNDDCVGASLTVGIEPPFADLPVPISQD